MIENATLSVSGFGSLSVICDQIQYGPTIIAAQDEGALLQTFYSHAVQYNTFSITIQFTTSAARRAFYDWILKYAKTICTPGGHSKAMRVQGPNGFDFVGIPSTGMMQHTAISDVTWTTTVAFAGAKPTAGNIWEYQTDTAYRPGNDSTSTFFYPLGNQLSAAQSADGGLYNTPTPAVQAIVSAAASSNYYSSSATATHTPPPVAKK